MRHKKLVLCYKAQGKPCPVLQGNSFSLWGQQLNNFTAQLCEISLEWDTS